MKKTISILLVLVLMMSLSVTAFATKYDAAPAESSADVSATYIPGGAGGTVFSIDIEWSEMEFTYQATKWAQWDPATHSYSEPVKASWSGEGTLTITNHSNTALKVVPGYKMDDGFTSTVLNFKVDDEEVTEVTVASAADTNAAVVKTITVTPEGKLASNANGKIGSVTVSVSVSEDVSLETAKKLVQDMLDLSNALDADDKTTFNVYIDAFRGPIRDFETGNSTQEQLNKAYNDALKQYNIYMGKA